MSSKTSTSVNNQPVIGILTIPLSNWLGDNIAIDSERAKSYLPAAYVRWIENSGARVVPIQYTLTKPIMNSYLAQVNGVIICGDISPVNVSNMKPDTQIEMNVIRWAKAEFHIFEWAKKQNRMGTYFPVLGIGMGYEELIFMHQYPKYYSQIKDSKTAMSNDKPFNPKEMVEISKTYTSNPFKLTSNPGIFGRKFSKKDQKIFATNKVCYTTPGWALNAKSKNVKQFETFLEINSIGKNKKLNTEYINAYSFKELPFYGLAFHPEAVIYSWVEEMIPQTDNDVLFSQKMSELFVNECRKNLTPLSSTQILIYNYTLFSPNKVLKILYPENWETMQLRKHFTNSYFFGLVLHKEKKHKQLKPAKGSSSNSQE